jgi:hypothetical protein
VISPVISLSASFLSFALLGFAVVEAKLAVAVQHLGTELVQERAKKQQMGLCAVASSFIAPVARLILARQT